MKLKTLCDSVSAADQVRALTEDTENSLKKALTDLAIALRQVKWALIGGLAVGFRAQPRGTQDVDIMLMGEDALAVAAALASDKFRHNRNHALTHKETGVEVELLTPGHIKMDQAVASKIIQTAEPQQLCGTTIPVASAEGLVAAKLNRCSLQDKADIAAIIRRSGPVQLVGFPLGAAKIAAYKLIEQEALNEKPLED